MSILGTILISAAGTAIATFFQDRAAKQTRVRTIRGSEMKRAVEIYSNLSQGMDNYWYWVNEVFEGYKLKVGQNDLERRWLSFFRADSEWEGMVNLQREQVSAYFGEKVEEIFSEINKTFSHLKGELDKLLTQQLKISEFPKDEGGKHKFTQRHNEVVDDIDYINKIMVRLIQEEKVGILRHPALFEKVVNN